MSVRTVSKKWTQYNKTPFPSHGEMRQTAPVLLARPVGTKWSRVQAATTAVHFIPKGPSGDLLKLAEGDQA